MENCNIETVKELKEVTEKYIFQMLTKFETDTGFKVSRISMMEVQPYLPTKKKPKLTGIELTIEL